MSTFYYNKFSGESYNSQWINYLQKKEHIKDITDITSKQLSEVNETIKSSSKEQLIAIKQSANVICGTLENGFELLSENLHEISRGLNDISSEINELSSILDWNLSLMIEQQRITNLLLGNIAILLRIPDIQKERQYYIEQGMKFLKNAIIDKDFYEDALQKLLKAEAIEPTDYYVLHRIGLIYLYSEKHLDLKIAEEYFKKSVKYSIAETNTRASVTKNYLAQELNKELKESIPSIEHLMLQSAESYLLAGRSCYIQGKFLEAADLAGKGFCLVPEMLEAGFTQAKSLAANGDEEKAAEILNKIINEDRFYSLKAIYDFDLCDKNSIIGLLNKLREDTTKEAADIYEECKKNIINESVASEYLSKIEILLNRNSYLTSKKAIDLLEKKMEWKFCEPFKNKIQSKSLDKIIAIINSFLNLRYYKVNNKYTTSDIFFDSLINRINEETQWIFPSYSIIKNNLNWDTQIQSKGGKFNVRFFVQAEKTYYDSLQKIISDFSNSLQKLQFENDNYLIEIDRENHAEAVRKGLLNGFSGLLIGIMVGFFVAIMAITLGTRITNGDINIYVIIVCEIIASIIGAIKGYSKGYKSKRKTN